MNLRSFVKAFAVVVLGLGLPHATWAGFSLFSNSWGDVIVATDATPAGKDLTPPSPAKPVYYRGLSLGCRLGSIAGDQLPDVGALNAFVAKVLAKQGYLAARPGVHDPSLFLVVQWGYLRPGSGDLLWFLGYNPSQDIAAPVFPGQFGPEVWRRSFRSRTIETILGTVSEPIYGIIVTAFEFKSANTRQPVIYWQTRIGLPANAKSMAEALPAMLVAAGPTIGRPSDSPVLRDVDEARRGHVDLGKLKIIGYEDLASPGEPDRPQP